MPKKMMFLADVSWKSDVQQPAKNTSNMSKALCEGCWGGRALQLNSIPF